MQKLLYAHRGASAERPENTMQAFSRALEVGATAIETDTHLTRDGIFVLSHDPTGGRMAAVAKAISSCTLDEVRGWDVGWGFLDAEGKRPFAGKGFRVPTLEEALVELPSVPFNVDLKTGDLGAADLAVRLVRKLRAEDRVRFASFDSRVVEAVRSLGYEGETGLGQREVVRVAFSPMALLRRVPPRGNAVQVPPRAGPFRLDTRVFTDKCHALGLRVDYWVINDPDEAERLFSIGADGVMTDDPARVAPHVGSAQHRKPTS